MPGSNTNVFGPKLGGLDASAAAVIPPVATNAAASSAPAIPAGNSRPGFILSFPPQKNIPPQAPNVSLSRSSHHHLDRNSEVARRPPRANRVRAWLGIPPTQALVVARECARGN